MKFHKIEVMGRWSLGVQDTYIKLSTAEIVTIQNRAIRMAFENLSDDDSFKFYKDSL